MGNIHTLYIYSIISRNSTLFSWKTCTSHVWHSWANNSDFLLTSFFHGSPTPLTPCQDQCRSSLSSCQQRLSFEFLLLLGSIKRHLTINSCQLDNCHSQSLSKGRLGNTIMLQDQIQWTSWVEFKQLNLISSTQLIFARLDVILSFFLLLVDFIFLHFYVINDLECSMNGKVSNKWIYK